MKPSKLNPLILATAAVLAGHANGATLAQYNFTSGSTASSDTELLTTASSITAGAGINNPAFTVDRVEIGGDDTTVAGIIFSVDDARSLALAQNSYLTFTLSIGSSMTVDISSIDFDYSSSNGFDFYFGVFSSVTGFTSGNQLAEAYGVDASSPSLSGPVDLSGNTAFQDLTGTNVEFRLYFTDNSGSNTRVHFLDNVSLEGTAVPEPSAALLGGLGLLALLRRRRA